MKTKFNIGSMKFNVAVPKEVTGADQDIRIDFELSNIETEVEGTGVELVQVLKEITSSVTALKRLMNNDDTSVVVDTKCSCPSEAPENEPTTAEKLSQAKAEGKHNMPKMFQELIANGAFGEDGEHPIIIVHGHPGLAGFPFPGFPGYGGL